MTLFEELKQNVEGATNSNFYFDKLDTVTGIWIHSLCNIIEKRLIISSNDQAKYVHDDNCVTQTECGGCTGCLANNTPAT